MDKINKLSNNNDGQVERENTTTSIYTGFVGIYISIWMVHSQITDSQLADSKFADNENTNILLYLL